MKKLFIFLNITLYVLSSSWVIAEDEIPPIIVSTTKASGFGIWKVYNAGEEIFFVDPDRERYLTVTASGTSLSLVFVPSHMGGIRFWLKEDGTSDPLTAFNEDENKVGQTVEISANITDGRYSFGKMRFFVSGENLTIFNIEDEDTSDNAVPSTIVKKSSNELVHTGNTATSPFEATLVLNADNAPGPALIQGDCLATYSGVTGKVEIPCLKVEGNEAIYSVGQQQIGGILTFEVVPAEIIRVQ